MNLKSVPTGIGSIFARHLTLTGPFKDPPPPVPALSTLPSRGRAQVTLRCEGEGGGQPYRNEA